jgi:hypothetical protein
MTIPTMRPTGGPGPGGGGGVGTEKLKIDLMRTY